MTKPALSFFTSQARKTADALSRQSVNVLQDDDVASDLATIHSEVSLTYPIDTCDKPVNCYRNQIILEEARFPLARKFIMFGSKTRHILHFTVNETLLRDIKSLVNPGVVNAIHCDYHTLAQVQNELVR